MQLANAVTAVENATFEGITTWRLPTVAEFRSLYATQGHVSSSDLHMNAAPFSGVQYLSYWTAEQAGTSAGFQRTYLPSNNGDGSVSNTCCSTGSPYTWAVASVPEPQTYAMLLAGMGLLGLALRRRRSAAPTLTPSKAI
jgi:hypothetical protein